MNKTILLLTSISFFSLSLVAGEEQSFEALLNEMSDVATKKSINVDYLPSVISVINAQTYIDGGIETIGEAINMLPGIQTQLSPMGYNITTVRGLKNPNAYLSDKLKILIDGVAINNEIQGSSSFYMDFPLTLVEKIEVLRGPGSTVYGAGAFYATINVITKLGEQDSQSQIYLGGGSYQTAYTGGNFQTQVANWNISTDAYYTRNDKRIRQDDGFSESGDTTNEAMQDMSIGFKVQNGGFEFLARYKESSYANFYGFEEILDPISNQDKEHTNAYFFTQFSYEKAFSGFNLETKVNYSNRRWAVDANIYDVNATANRFEVVDVDLQKGFYYSEGSEEENIEFEAILSLPKIYENDILIGSGIRHVKVIKDDFYSSIEESITANRDAIETHNNFDDFRYNREQESAFWNNMTTTLLKDNLERNIVYAYVNDLISLHKNVDMVLGLRVDNYSDFGTQLSKRAALVYRANDEIIFKLLYGSAFRAPTFIEAYQNGHINFRAGDENIQPEEVDTYEFVTIYKPTLSQKVSLNFYYSQLSNVIDLEEYPNTDPGYRNFKDRDSKGVEFEYNFRSCLAHNLYLSASYIDAIYTIPPEEGEESIDQSMPDISKFLASAMYIYSPFTALSFGSTWRYNSKTTQTELNWVHTDTTAKANAIFDETITYRFTASSTLRFSIKNLFNEDIREPSYYYKNANGIKREGRSYSLRYTQTF